MATTQRSGARRDAWTPHELAGDVHGLPEKAAKVQRMFGAIAGAYDLNNRLHSFGRDQSWRRRAVAMVDVGPEDDVLDVACGTGDLAEAFCDAQPRSVLGVDFTPEMLELAAAKAARRTRQGRPSPLYRSGDATDLALPNGSFDIVSIAFGIRNVSDPRKALTEFLRVLRPGGRLVIVEFSRPRNAVLALLNDLYMRRVMPLSATLISGDRSGAYRYLPRSIDTFEGPEALAEQIAGAGLEVVTQERRTFGVCTISLARKPL